MIGKLLLIRESGLLPFYLSQDEIEIDHDLLSGFCMANNSIAKELNDSIDMLLMKNNHKILFKQYESIDKKKFIMAIFCHKYHINQGIHLKMDYIFDRFFKNYDFKQDNLTIRDEKFSNEIQDVLNDEMLKEKLRINHDFIQSVIEPVVMKDSNQIHGYAFASSANEILMAHFNSGFLEKRTDNLLTIPLLEHYLNEWNMKIVPQGDVFEGPNMVAGLDLEDFVRTNHKTFGLCINTSINHPDEPKNEILLYFFGKNILMRQCMFDIEEILRENLQ